MGGAGTLSAEINDGCAPETQCHLALPEAYKRPPGLPSQAGRGDAELGVKYRFLAQQDRAWSAAVYPTLFIPTGDASRGLGNGRAQLLLPVSLEHAAGEWSLDAGAGYLLNRASGRSSDWYTGLLAQRALGDALSVGADVFHRSSPSESQPSSSGFNLGAIVNVAAHENMLVSIGRALSHLETNQASLIAYQLEL